MRASHPTVHQGKSSHPVKHEDDQDQRLRKDRVFLAVVVVILVAFLALLFAFGVWTEATIDTGGMDPWIMP